MKSIQVRSDSRTKVDMNLRSTKLPHFKAKLIDLSQGGAKLRLRAKPSSSLVNEEMKFSASLPRRSKDLFRGQAKVVWEKETKQGFTLGLRWSELPSYAEKAIAAAQLYATNG